MPTRPSELLRLVPFAIAVLLALGAGWLAVAVSGWWLPAAVPGVLLVALGIHDLLQPHHNILRNYPIIGHGRYLAEDLRPELQQYFVEEDTTGRPYDRDTRAVVYERAKLENEEKPFGTERDLYAPGPSTCCTPSRRAPLPTSNPACASAVPAATTPTTWRC